MGVCLPGTASCHGPGHLCHRDGQPQLGQSGSGGGGDGEPAGVPAASDQHFNMPTCPCSDRWAARRTCAAGLPFWALALLLVVTRVPLPAAGGSAPCLFLIARRPPPRGALECKWRSTASFFDLAPLRISQNGS